MKQVVVTDDQTKLGRRSGVLSVQICVLNTGSPPAILAREMSAAPAPRPPITRNTISTVLHFAPAQWFVSSLI